MSGVALRRGTALALAAIVLLGGALRAVEAASPRVAEESVDERFYAALARGLAERGHYGDRSRGPFHPFHAAPGAPFAFAAAHMVTPASAREPTRIPAAYWLLALAGTLLIPATFLLARAVAADGAGLVAAGAVAVYPPLVRATGELLGEPLGSLLLVTGVAALALGVRDRRRRLLALGGALLGGAALVRPDLLAVVAACPVALLVLGRRTAPLAARAAHAAVALLASSVVLLPWVAYASARKGELVPVVDSGGPTLMIGTYLPGDGTNQGFKRAHADATRRRLPRLRALRDLELPGVAVIETVRRRHPGLGYDAALRAEAREHLRRYALGRPADFAAMLVRKAWRMWDRPAQVRGTAARAAHLVLVLVAAAGLLTGLVRARDAALVLIATAIASSTALHAVLVAHPRYALPLMPLLLAGGAAGAARILRLGGAPT